MNKIRILYLHQDGLITGSAMSLLILLDYLDRNVFEPVVIIRHQGPLEQELSKRSIQCQVVNFAPIWTMPTSNFTKLVYYVNFLVLLPNRKLKEVMLAIRPDIVHVNDRASLRGLIEGKKLGYKTILHSRSTYSRNGSAIQILLSSSLIKKYADCVVAISEDELDHLQGAKSKRVIANSVDFEKVQEAINDKGASFKKQFNISSDEIVVAYIGKFFGPKGYVEFLKAVKICSLECSNLKVRYVFIAEIPGRDMNYGIRGNLGLIDNEHPLDKANRILNELGIPGLVEFVGSFKNILNVIAGTDIVVNCQQVWAIGRVGFEASSVGVPAIVNNGWSGKSNVVVNEKTGLTVPGRDVNALAGAMIRLITNKALREQLGANGVIHAKQNFDAKTNSKKVEMLYKQLIENKIETRN